MIRNAKDRLDPGMFLSRLCDLRFLASHVGPEAEMWPPRILETTKALQAMYQELYDLAFRETP